MTTPVAGDFAMLSTGPWTIWIRAPWHDHVTEIIAQAEQTTGWRHRSKHARSRPVEIPGLPPAYLKRYQRYGWTGTVKDCFRSSKPRHALVISTQLQQHGFAAPGVLAAGERRVWGVVEGGFLLTRAVEGPDLLELLAGFAGKRDPRPKRNLLRDLGGQIAGLHDAGFYHGDLVPSNIRVQGAGSHHTLVFLDNDRTRALGRPVPLHRARRNLVQLNRFVVQGVTAVDRWRVFRSYCAGRGIDETTRAHLARWVMKKTMARRRQFDGIEDAELIGFRSAMRYDDRRSV